MEMEEEINAEIDRLLDAKQAIIKSIRKKMALFDLIPYNYI